MQHSHQNKVEVLISQYNGSHEVQALHVSPSTYMLYMLAYTHDNLDIYGVLS
jgi:hypothetical protein